MQSQIKSKFSYFFSIILTIFVLTILIFFSPANAITISIQSQENNLQYGEVFDFQVDINIDSNERVPIEDIKIIIEDENQNVISTCNFFPNTSKTDNCDIEFQNISLIDSDINFDYGLINFTYNNSEIFGYGYGYGNYQDYGFNKGSQNGFIKYQISWQTPQEIKNQRTKYFVKTKIHSRVYVEDIDMFSQNSIELSLDMLKPEVFLSQNIFSINEGETLILSSNFYEPNNFSINEFLIYDESNNLIKTSNSQTIPLTNFNIGENKLKLQVKNEHNISSEFFNFTVNVSPLMNMETFDFEVNEIIKNNNIEFSFFPKQNISNKKLNIKTELTCLNIPMKMKTPFSEDIVLSQEDEEYKFKINLNDFKIKVPLDNSCTFKLKIFDYESGREKILSKDIIFKNENTLDEFDKIEINLDSQTDLSEHMFKSLSKSFSKGFNSLNYKFNNDGPVEIKVEMGISINSLNMNSIESIKIAPNSQGNIFIPIFVDENTPKGKHPVRISYRLNNQGDLRVKYAYLLVE